MFVLLRLRFNWHFFVSPLSPLFSLFQFACVSPAALATRKGLLYELCCTWRHQMFSGLFLFFRFILFHFSPSVWCICCVSRRIQCIQWTHQSRSVQASGDECIIRWHRTRQPGNSFEYQMMNQCKRDYAHYLSLLFLFLFHSHPAPFFSLLLCARNFNFKLIVPMKLKL